MLPSWMRSRNWRPRLVYFFGDGDHQTQVGADELLLGAHGGGVAALDAPQHFFQVVDVVAALFLQAAQDLDLADDHFL